MDRPLVRLDKLAEALRLVENIEELIPVERSRYEALEDTPDIAHHRSEHWLVVKGIAYIHLDGRNFEVKKGNSVDIKNGEKHFIANNEDEDLIIIIITIF